MAEKLKSRTLALSDDDWAIISRLAIVAGFGEKGRGRAIVKLAKDWLKRNDNGS